MAGAGRGLREGRRLTIAIIGTSSNGHPGAHRDGVDARFGVDQVHRIRFTHGAFEPANRVLRDIIAGAAAAAPVRTIAVVDAGVAAAWPGLAGELDDYATAHADVMKLLAAPIVVAGGEEAKNDWGVYHTVVEAIETHHICRQSFVLAIGGGAMLDAVGFATSTAHRGVRLIRFPTTTLAQDDAGIGVKNGINAFGKKNFIGAFGVPWAVINDDRFLTSLNDRDWRSGLSEAVKVALLKDAAYFDQLVACAPALGARDHAAVVPIVRRCAELHLDHIASGGDPFEMLNARPLDFGHWSAHKLEQMTDYALRHGEAVAIGVALDCVYAERMGFLAADETERVLGALAAMGFALDDPALERADELLDGLDEFREHLGGVLTITLLDAPGRPRDVHEIDLDAMRHAIADLRERAAVLA